MADFAQKPKEQLETPARAAQAAPEAAAAPAAPMPGVRGGGDVKGVFDHFTDAPVCAAPPDGAGGGHEKEKQELVAKINALDIVKDKGLHGAFDHYAGKNASLDANALQRLLTDAAVGNGLTRGIWAKTIMQELDRCPKDGVLQWHEMPFETTTKPNAK